MNTEGRTEGVRELIVAIFRLAVADHRGFSYGHEEPGRRRRIKPVHEEDAAAFLQSRWAGTLADLVGLSSAAIWREARRRVDPEVAARRHAA